MRVFMIILTLLAAHLNLTALVPLKPGDAPPPWWVGGRLIWPFAIETRTLVSGNLLNTITPLLGIGAAISFLLAAGALFGWLVPSQWFLWLVVFGTALSIVLQIIWFSPWAILPLLVDIALLWAVFGMGQNVERLRG